MQPVVGRTPRAFPHLPSDKRLDHAHIVPNQTRRVLIDEIFRP
jgi:hypothetical protein